MSGWKQSDADNSLLGWGRCGALTTVRDGLVGEFLFGRDLTICQDNSAAPVRLAGTPGVLQFRASVGVPPPVYGDHEVELGNGLGFDTNVTATDQQTIMVISRLAAPGYYLAGVSVDDASTISVMYDGDGKITVGSISQGTFARSANPVATPVGDHRAIALRVAGHAAGSAVMIDEFKAGARVQGNSTPLPFALSASGSNIVIGNTNQLYPNQVPGRNNTLGALIWSRALTDAELLASYLTARAFAAGCGRAI